MTSNTNWDVEKYKSPFECQEHWELRRSFLIAHKDKYPEKQLVCLAQVFFNVELLGCKYPDETMALIAELSEGVADAFRAKKKQKLQRTFVKASDAAGAKIKGLSLAEARSVSEPTTEPGCMKSTWAVIPNSSVNKEANVNDKTKGILSTAVVDLCNTIAVNKMLGNAIILKNLTENFFDDGTPILQRSLSKEQVHAQYSYVLAGAVQNPEWTCTISCQNHYIAHASATSKQVAKKAACEALLNSMQAMCFTIVEKVRVLSDGSKVDKNLEQAVEEPDVPENSIGNKMMKLMGWKGGGLGKTEQGRAEPIRVQERVHRSGLGVNLSEQKLMKKLNFQLKAFARDETSYDLVFSNDFSKDERAKLHAIAAKYHLKTRSHGSGDRRHLVVSKRVINYKYIVESLLSCGGENERYQLIPPSNFGEPHE